MMRDLRFALRTALKNHWFTLTVVSVLTIAIAGATAVFSVSNAIILRPLPYSDPSRLVLLDPVHKDDGSSYGFTINRFELVREHTKSLSGFAGAASDSMNLTVAGDSQQVAVTRVTPNFFSILGIGPALGRDFLPQEGTAEGANVVIIGHTLWAERFGRDPHITDKTVVLDGVPTQIVGVLPASAKFPFVPEAQVYSPRYFELTLFSTARLRRGTGYLTAIGRIAPGKTPQEVQAEMTLLHDEYGRQFPDAPDMGPEIRLLAKDLHGATVADSELRLWVVAAAVALVLFIACANIAGLLLARAGARRGEIVTRLALGASRADIIRQLLIEGLLLSLVACIIALPISFALSSRLAQVASTSAASLFQASWGDFRVLLFAVLLAVVVTILFSLMPAIDLSRTDIAQGLRTQTGGSTSDRHLGKARLLLVSGQVALSLVLMVSSGLLLHSLLETANVDPGFDPKHLVAANISLPVSRYQKPEQQIAFFQQLTEKVRSLPGVVAAGISNTLPLTSKRATPLLPEGQAEVPISQRPVITVDQVDGGIFLALGTPLRAGRVFTDADNRTSHKVLMVNEGFVRKFWPQQNPIGKHVTIGYQSPAEVVGVVGDVKNAGLAADPTPEIYVPYGQIAWSNMYIFVRTSTEPHALIPMIRRELASVDQDVAFAAPTTGEEIMANAGSQPRMMAIAVGAFAFLALALSVIGLYGLSSYFVAQRTRELAIRIAVGAGRSDLILTAMKEALIMACAGSIVGIIGAIIATRSLKTVLYRVHSLDPLTYAACIALLVLTAVLAAYLPTRRITRIHPAMLLR